MKIHFNTTLSLSFTDKGPSVQQKPSRRRKPTQKLAERLKQQEASKAADVTASGKKLTIFMHIMIWRTRKYLYTNLSCTYSPSSYCILLYRQCYCHIDDLTTLLNFLILPQVPHFKTQTLTHIPFLDSSTEYSTSYHNVVLI